MIVLDNLPAYNAYKYSTNLVVLLNTYDSEAVRRYIQCTFSSRDEGVSTYLDPRLGKSLKVAFQHGWEFYLRATGYWAKRKPLVLLEILKALDEDSILPKPDDDDVVDAANSTQNETLNKAIIPLLTPEEYNVMVHIFLKRLEKKLGILDDRFYTLDDLLVPEAYHCGLLDKPVFAKPNELIGNETRAELMKIIENMTQYKFQKASLTKAELITERLQNLLHNAEIGRRYFVLLSLSDFGVYNYSVLKAMKKKDMLLNEVLHNEEIIEKFDDSKAKTIEFSLSCDDIIHSFYPDVTVAVSVVADCGQLNVVPSRNQTDTCKIVT
uniref:DDE-1 domain-containing protein n=1 Tax=Syphacia muris TaxID=451379 RepID=A0A0N5AL89_9BILA